MKRPADLVTENKHFKYFTNKECPFFPCHEDIPEKEFNCLFCYCPLQALVCSGPYKSIEINGGIQKDCSACTLNHRGLEKSYEYVLHWLDLNWRDKGGTLSPSQLITFNRSKNR